MSMGSRPAFSDSVFGTISIESAKASIASCSLPPTFVAYSRVSFAISASIAPPPGTILLFSMTSETTERASFIARSASSTMRSKPARIRIDTDWGDLHFSMKTILSSPTLRSSTRPLDPKSALVRSSKFVTILAPVALASFSMSDCFTLLTARIPFLAKKCCAKSSIPFWQSITLAPEAVIFFTISLIMRVSWSRKACIWVGSLMRISELISVFSTSSGQSRRAIFALLIVFGIPEWTTSLSIMMPLMS